ncbi:MAG: DUF2868 domain-containing protein [Planctomycetota bacterium]
MGKPGRVGLAELIDLAVALERDRSGDPSSLRRRDEAIGARLREAGVASDDRRGLLKGWLAALRREAGGGEPRPLPGRRWALAAWRAVAIAAALMALIGWASAMGVFWYDGVRPVNLTVVVLAYGVLPLALLGLTLWGAAAGLGPMGEWVRGLSPGRLALWAGRRGSGGVAAAGLADELGVLGHAGLAGVRKWAVLSASQWLAVGFFSGVLIGAVQRVVFTELSFGWSTTLKVEPMTVLRLAQWWSLPWGWAWEGAVPKGQGLVAMSQYVPGEGLVGGPGAGRVWWRFVLMTVLVYAWLPRAVTAGWFAWLLREAVEGAFDRLPGTALLADRLAGASAWRGPGVSGEASMAQAGGMGVSVSTAATESVGGVVVRWAGAGGAIDAGETLEAGGSAGLAADRAVVERLGEMKPTSLRVVVRGWEPPTLEALDFLREVRGAVGDGRVIEVAAEAMDGAGTGDELRAWRGAIDRLGDGDVRLVMLGRGQGAGGGGRR